MLNTNIPQMSLVRETRKVETAYLKKLEYITKSHTYVHSNVNNMVLNLQLLLLLQQ